MCMLKPNCEGVRALDLPFSPQSDLVDARAALRRVVDSVLDGLATGKLPSHAERQRRATS